MVSLFAKPGSSPWRLFSGPEQLVSNLAMFPGAIRGFSGVFEMKAGFVCQLFLLLSGNRCCREQNSAPKWPKEATALGVTARCPGSTGVTHIAECKCFICHTNIAAFDSVDLPHVLTLKPASMVIKCKWSIMQITQLVTEM